MFWFCVVLCGVVGKRKGNDAQECKIFFSLPVGKEVSAQDVSRAAVVNTLV